MWLVAAGCLLRVVEIGEGVLVVRVCLLLVVRPLFSDGCPPLVVLVGVCWLLCAGRGGLRLA